MNKTHYALVVWLLLAMFTLSSASSMHRGQQQQQQYQQAHSMKQQQQVTYDPNWQSIDSRPLPSWYDEAKFGIFIHWGVFSVPAFGGYNDAAEWFWSNWQQNNKSAFVDFMNKNYPPGFSYPEFAPQFHAEFFNPNDWAQLFANSGAKYVVLTSKHHEGWTNWKSNASWNWNSVDNGPHRDLVGDLTAAVRSKNLTMGLYFSLYEWFHPLYLEDKSNNYQTSLYVEQVVKPQIKDIVSNYQPEVIWADGDWEAADTYWNSTEILAWLYNESPVKDTVVVNDRWGSGVSCKHGGFYTCDDRYNPGVLQAHKWENCMTIDRYSWGFRREAVIEDYLTTHDLLNQLVTTVSCGGNLLLNVGPSADGTIAPVFQQRLTEMGSWLQINGEAIYNTSPWRKQNDSAVVWYTLSKTNVVYATVLEWPSTSNGNLDGVVKLTSPVITANTDISMLGYGEVQWKADGSNILVQFPTSLMGTPLQAQTAWVLKLQNVS